MMLVVCDRLPLIFLVHLARDIYNTEIGNCYVTPINVIENTLVARQC